MKVKIKTHEEYNMYCVEATIDDVSYMKQYFSSETERDAYYHQLTRFTQKIAQSAQTNTPSQSRGHGYCDHTYSRRKWGRVVSESTYDGNTLREWVDICSDCGKKVDSGHSWD